MGSPTLALVLVVTGRAVPRPSGQTFGCSAHCAPHEAGCVLSHPNRTIVRGCTSLAPSTSLSLGESIQRIRVECLHNFILPNNAIKILSYVVGIYNQLLHICKRNIGTVVIDLFLARFGLGHHTVATSHRKIV